MGLLDLFVSKTSEPTPGADVTAGFAPYEPYNPFTGATDIGSTTFYSQAIAVPSVARAKGIICSTVASLPLEQYDKFTGAHIEPNRVINQPDPRVPGSVIYSWLALDLWAYGFAYGMVMERYADGRISAWTRIAYSRVTPQYNVTGTEIEGYLVDGQPVLLNDFIVFYGLDEGFLNRAGKTVRAALWLEKAAENYAKNPVPSTVLKSNGTNLTADRIRSLLAGWTKARQDSSTAFLNADVDLQVLGFSPEQLGLNSARQYVALEIARQAGIPAYFLSAETTSMTYSNAISERKSLIDFSLRPILTAIEQRLSMSDFIPSQTQEIRFSLDDFLRGDPLQRAQVYQILNTIGAMSVAQIQEEEDLIDNGN
jgi:HK97 family phage portal protein